MYKRNFKILLIISLAFNIAFIGFSTFRYLTIKRILGSEKIFHNIPHNIKDRFQKNKEEIGSVRDEIAVVRHDFMVELRKEDFNKDNLNVKLANILIKQNEMERILGNNLIELREEMTPEQAEKFFSRFPAEEHHKPKDKRKPFRPGRKHEKPQ